MSALTYIVTILPAGRSEPVEEHRRVETGDPDIDADRLIDDIYINEGGEVIHIRWSTGETIYHAKDIDA